MQLHQLYKLNKNIFIVRTEMKLCIYRISIYASKSNKVSKEKIQINKIVKYKILQYHPISTGTVIASTIINIFYENR